MALDGKYMHVDDVIAFVKTEFGRDITAADLMSQPTTRFVSIQGNPGAVTVTRDTTSSPGKTILTIK